MSVETKHSPLPWRRPIASSSGYGGIVDAKDNGVVNWTGMARPQTVGVQNTEFIVRACNAHNDLVAALAVTLRMLESAQMQIGMRPDDKAHVYKARAALAKASA